jgi:hypothetical protein
MTSAELANHLQALECKYASFTNKLSLALQHGSSNLECLQNTALMTLSARYAKEDTRLAFIIHLSSKTQQPQRRAHMS